MFKNNQSTDNYTKTDARLCALSALKYGYSVSGRTASPFQISTNAPSVFHAGLRQNWYTSKYVPTKNNTPNFGAYNHLPNHRFYQSPIRTSMYSARDDGDDYCNDQCDQLSCHGSSISGDINQCQIMSEQGGAP